MALELGDLLFRCEAPRLYLLPTISMALPVVVHLHLKLTWAKAGRETCLKHCRAAGAARVKRQASIVSRWRADRYTVKYSRSPATLEEVERRNGCAEDMEGGYQKAIQKQQRRAFQPAASPPASPAPAETSRGRRSPKAAFGGDRTMGAASIHSLNSSTCKSGICTCLEQLQSSMPSS